MRDSADSRAALLAGAGVLRQWIHAQRATWTDVEGDLARIAAPARPAAPIPVTPRPVAAQEPAPLPAPIPTPPAFVSAPVAPLAAVAAPAVVDERPVLQLPTADESFDAANEPSTGGFGRLPLPTLPEFPRDEALASAAPDVTFLPDTTIIAAVPKVWVSSREWVWKAAAVVAVMGVLGTTGYVARGTFSARRAAAPPTGTAILESTDAATTVVVDGAPLGKTPLKLELPAGKHAVEFRRNGATKTMNVDVVAGQSATARAEWGGGKRVGTLEITTTPSGVKVSVDGKDRGATPLTLNDVAVGAHAVVLRTGDGLIKRSVTVSEDKPTQLNEDIFSGFIHVSAGIEIQMAEGRRAITLDDRNQALLGPGTHEIRFSNRTFAYTEVRTVEVKPGAITEVTIEAPTSLLSVSATAAGEVFVDGERAGELPLTDFPVRVGTREIVVRSAGGERRFTRTITTAPTALEVDFAAP